MKAESDAELTCRAHNYHFGYNGKQTERGIISYYAARALAQANTIESWAQLINDMSESDLQKGLITPFHKPLLQITGDSKIRLIGNPINATFESHE
jgi:hypothetical protein